MTDTTATIADQMAEMRTNPRRPLPADVAAAFGQWVAQLTAAGVPAGAAKPGMTITDVPLLDAHGAPTSLRAATAGRPTVIVFYRGAWCPYCNLTLRAYQDQLHPALTERGVRLIAVSPQRADGSLTAQEKLGTDLHAVNADGTENLPMPTVVLIDAESTIRWIDIHPDYTTRTEVTDILAAADTVFN